MSFIKRLGYYLGGFSVGLIFLFSFLTVKERSVTTALQQGLKVIYKRKCGYLKMISIPSKTPCNGLLKPL